MRSGDGNSVESAEITLKSMAYLTSTISAFKRCGDLEMNNNQKNAEA
jgi:hypothetical protein